MIQPSHVEFQQQVLELAQLYGWQCLTVRRTVGRGRKWTTSTSITGWPDCFFFAPGRGFLAIELKVGKDKPTPAQRAVLDDLERAGAKTMVAYPEDLDALRTLLARRVT